MTGLAIVLPTTGLALAAPAPKELGRTCEFAGIKFKVGEKYLQLNSPHFPTEEPEKVEGIKVGGPFAKLHILHASGYGSSPEGSPKHVPDDPVIAEYKVRYDDGETATIEVVYGKVVRDYWFNDGSKGRVAGRWRGRGTATRPSGSGAGCACT